MAENHDGYWVEGVTTLAGLRAEHDVPYYPETCTVHKDELTDFSDCDYLILMADIVSGSLVSPLFTLQPYAVVAHDYIQRYCPRAVSKEALDIKVLNQTRADRVLVTSVPTLNDAIQYGGLPESKVVLTPLLLDPLEKPVKLTDEAGEKEETGREGKYFIWSTNPTPHKNHLRALKGLLSYYEKGGSLDCVMTGANTDFFDLNNEVDTEGMGMDYVAEVRELIQAEPVLKRHLKIRGNMKKSTYTDVLAKACFIFHPGYGDNGNGTAIDAAGVGVPALSSDYPAMRYLADFMGLSFHYMSAFEPDSMAKALMDMEANYEAYARELPSREQLAERNYRAQGARLYEALKRERIL